MTEIRDWHTWGGLTASDWKCTETPMVWPWSWPEAIFAGDAIITHPRNGETMWIAHDRNKEPTP